MAQQTAVEWLIEQMKKGEVAYGMFHVSGQTEIFEQAKEMEKKQIDEAHYDGYYREDMYDSRNYYYDTFKK